MKLTISKFKFWVLKEWSCCDYLWQLLLSKKYPERYSWKPTCPNCGKEGDLK